MYLASNSSYPPIPVTVNIASNAASSVTNTATVSGGGDVNLANNSASDPTNILPNAVAITVATNISGPTVTVDSGTPFTGSQTFTWVPSSSHTIATSTPQSGGAGIAICVAELERLGGDFAQLMTMAVDSHHYYTAHFQMQYLLTTAVSPSGEGTISPASEYVNASSSVSAERVGELDLCIYGLHRRD